MNSDDDQRADDLERVLDEGALPRAAKMLGKWSSAHAQVALKEVQARSDAHRVSARSGSEGDAAALDLSQFTLRDEELSSLRETLPA
jgi:hypothetical protein